MCCSVTALATHGLCTLLLGGRMVTPSMEEVGYYRVIINTGDPQEFTCYYSSTCNDEHNSQITLAPPFELCGLVFKYLETVQYTGYLCY